MHGELPHDWRNATIVLLCKVRAVGVSEIALKGIRILVYVLGNLHARILSERQKFTTTDASQKEGNFALNVMVTFLYFTNSAIIHVPSMPWNFPTYFSLLPPLHHPSPPTCEYGHPTLIFTIILVTSALSPMIIHHRFNILLILKIPYLSFCKYQSHFILILQHHHPSVIFLKKISIKSFCSTLFANIIKQILSPLPLNNNFTVAILLLRSLSRLLWQIFVLLSSSFPLNCLLNHICLPCIHFLFSLFNS